jgi:hypothetical protein
MEESAIMNGRWNGAEEFGLSLNLDRMQLGPILMCLMEEMSIEQRNKAKDDASSAGQ